MGENFYSPKVWRDPDVEAYQEQKQVCVIALENRPTCSKEPRPVRHLFGGYQAEQRWEEHHCGRLVTAALGKRDKYMAPFPGHTVPGSGGYKNTRYRGSLAIEQFENLMQLQGGFPLVGPLFEGHPGMKPLDHKIESLPRLPHWRWKYVAEPLLQLLTPAHGELPVPTSGMSQLTEVTLHWIRSEIEGMMKIDKPKTREFLSFVRRLWSPHSKPVFWAPETVEGATETIKHFQGTFYKERIDWIGLAFELEATFSRFEYSWQHNVHGYGGYHGSWVEVGRLSLARIQQTELAVTRRVLQELVNIRTKGFAPIVVNEHGCNTDGTHRFLATWLWNLLQAVSVSPDIECDDFQYAVALFINEYKRGMGPIVVREALRVLAEFLLNEDMRRVLKEEVIPYLHTYHPVSHLPVLLLPEYSCGAVIKGPYDDGLATYRVDPHIYEILTDNRACTLPARGPYHLTDRAMLPWFQVLEER